LIEQHGEPAQLIYVWFSNNSRLAVVILVGIVFFFILIIVGVPRRHRGADEAQPREDAFRHASGHVGLPLDGHVQIPLRRKHVSRREPQIILKTDGPSIVFEPGLGGKLSAKSTAWDENRVFLEGDKLEVAVKNGRWGLTHLLAGPRPAAELLRCYFPGDCNGVASVVTPLLKRRCNRRNAVTHGRSRRSMSVMKRLRACAR
jgi:hypothetical protein